MRPDQDIYVAAPNKRLFDHWLRDEREEPDYPGAQYHYILDPIRLLGVVLKKDDQILILWPYPGCWNGQEKRLEEIERTKRQLEARRASS